MRWACDACGIWEEGIADEMPFKWGNCLITIADPFTPKNDIIEDWTLCDHCMLQIRVKLKDLQ